MTFFDRLGDVEIDISYRKNGPVDRRARARGCLRSFLSVASASLLLFATACQDPVQRAENYAQQAQSLMDAGDARGALDAINNAIAVRDDNPNYFLLLGVIYIRTNASVDAFNAFKRVLELDAANVTALSYVANLGLQIGRIGDADDAADKLLALNPNSPVGLQVKGLVALVRDHYDEAQHYADRMLSISPSDEAGTIIQARSLAKLGKFEDALALIDKAMVVTGKTPALLITKINLYRVLRQPEQMETTYEQLMPLIGNQSARMKLDYINLLYKTGKADKARTEALDFLAAGSNDPDDYRVLQRIWLEFDPTPFTRQTIKQASRWTDPLSVLAVGRFLLWQNSSQIASDLYFAVGPKSARLVNSVRARANAGLGRSDAAHRILDQILDHDKDDVDALLLRAQFQREAGHLNLAIDAAQKALQSDPFDPEAYSILADLNMQSGDQSHARGVLEDGLKQLPQDFLLIDKYTDILHKLGDKDRAVSVTRAFARALPSSEKAWKIFAAQCAWAKDATCAAEAEAGRANAEAQYRLDEAPGVPMDRGLLGQF